MTPIDELRAAPSVPALRVAMDFVAEGRGAGHWAAALALLVPRAGPAGTLTDEQALFAWLWLADRESVAVRGGLIALVDRACRLAGEDLPQD